MKPKDLLTLLILPIIWGCYYVASKHAVGVMSSFVVGVLVRSICFILLLSLMFFKKELKHLLNVKYILPRLILIGFMGYLLDLTAFLGLSMSVSTSGVALLKCDIIFVNVASVFIYKERFTKVDWACTFVMLVGVLIVMGVDLGGISLADKGNVFFILSAIFVTVNAFVIKSVQHDKRNPANDNVIAFYNNFITMVLFFVSSVVMGTLVQIKDVAHNQALFTAIGVAGVGQMLIYQIYYYNLRRFPVWIVKVFLLLMPVMSAVVSFVIFNDVLKHKQFVGMAVVLIGALGIILEQKRKSDKVIVAMENCHA